MTKAKTKAQRKAGRKRNPGPREPNGRRQRPTAAQAAEDAQKTAAEARRRALGYPDTPQARRAALSPLCGDPLGMCIMAMHPAERRQDDLWQIWQAMSQAKQNWQQRIMAGTGSPQAAAIAMLPDAMQADDGHSIDIRTAEERDDGARRAWDYWLALLMELQPGERHALRGHLDGYGLPLWANHAPTASGAAAVRALVALESMRQG